MRLIEHVGPHFAMRVASETDALSLALGAFDLGAGD